ncbi:PrsW family intramembrane metalloprotease [Psychromicrobium xiongbiense]|uniref:PrsW family intramembrane metalloprotease n=1 Tax=Psychromicrobium xiongbiense TaxID=3051184 RepID=UPI0025566BC5|nr:PrsW family glutamic-type intramembrane protease [Psychromicrobium sp. YIM S02556]
MSTPNWQNPSAAPDQNPPGQNPQPYGSHAASPGHYAGQAYEPAPDQQGQWQNNQGQNGQWQHDGYTTQGYQQPAPGAQFATSPGYAPAETYPAQNPYAQNPYAQDPYARAYSEQPYLDPHTPSMFGRVDPTSYTPAPNYGYAQQPIQPIWTQQQQAKRTKVSLNIVLLLSIAGTVAALLGVFYILPNLYRAGGVGGITVGFILSLFPLCAVLTSVWIIDRWDPKPKWMLGFALFWGIAGSIGTTLLIQPVYIFIFMPKTLTSAQASQWLATFEAPPVEEFSKGLGVLLIALFAKKYLDGPLDGVVYATVIAAGFAFTENIQYFGKAFAASQEQGQGAMLVGILFLIRGVLSPFGHALYTACTGLMIGFAARRGRNGYIIGSFFLGMIPAMYLHMVWNSANLDWLLSTTSDITAQLGVLFLQCVMYQMPLIILWVVGLVFLIRSEAKLTHRRLAEYAEQGWFTPEEVTMLATPQGRRSAMSWARSVGRGHSMKNFIRSSTTLAAIRQRILTGKNLRQNQNDEQELLDQITALRPSVLG